MTQPQQIPPEVLAAAVASRTLTVERYQASQARVAAQVVQLVTRAIQKFGVPTTDRQQQQFARRVYPEVVRARAQSYVLGVRHMQSAAIVADEPMPEIAQPRPYEPEAIEKALKRAVETPQAKPDQVRGLDQVTRAQASRPASPDRRPNRVTITERAGATLSRHAHQAGRDAVQDTARRATNRVGWARVLTGDESCAWCAMLASRGPVFRGKGNALYRGGVEGNPYHDHCDCTATLVFFGKAWDGEESYAELEQLWSDTAGKESGQGKYRAFRRAFERPELHLPEDNPWRQNHPAESAE